MTTTQRGGREPELSVVIPVHDEEDSLEPLHRELDAILPPPAERCEILFVDDGSADQSLSRLRLLAQKDPRVRVFHAPRCRGQSAALATGFRAARGEIIVTLDADLQNDPADIPRLLAELERADVVSGVRVGRRDSRLRLLSSRIANAVRNWATGDAIRDVGCSLRAMRRRYVIRIWPFRGMHRFLPTLLRMQGARLAEIDVAHRPRRYGQSSYGVHNRLWAGIADLLGVCWMQRRALPDDASELD